MSRRPRRVVYTALTGGYEELLDQPAARGSAIDFVCLTDDPDLHSADWRMVVVEPVLPADIVRSARALKITGHPSLAGYDELLWIDNRVRLTADPDEVLDQWLATDDLAVPRHSFRADVVSEFQAVLDAGLDDSSRLYEQLTHYAALDQALLRRPIPWTGLVARRRSEGTDAAMEQWMRHVLRYSRRDQLSFVQAMHEADTTWTSIEISNLGSEVHEWRAATGRSDRPSRFQVADSLVPPTAALGELRLAYEQTVHGLVGAVESREQALLALTEASERQEAIAAELERELAELRRQRDDDQAALKRLRRRVAKVRRKKRNVEQ
ncbi:MAG TPA: glycosyltransferase domain-containing protein, partial [Nocardioides sp.]|uniref:glycosyltransferase domain-containing protein n=1 Tax=Nocardioides sp. TaxID=35761 RepID=UPI002E371B75